MCTCSVVAGEYVCVILFAVLVSFGGAEEPFTTSADGLKLAKRHELYLSNTESVVSASVLLQQTSGNDALVNHLKKHFYK